LRAIANAKGPARGPAADLGVRPTVVLFACLLLPTLAYAADAPSYAKEVAPIFAANCAGCHGGNNKMGNLSLETYDSLKQGGHTGQVIVPGKSEESRLYLLITRKAQPPMPLTGKPLAEGEIDIIKRWIDAGALPPKPGEAMPVTQAIPDIKPRAPVKPEIGALAWRPDGKVLALGVYKEVRLTDPESGKTIATLPGEAQEVRALSFSPDGKLLAAAGGLPARSGEVKIWDVDKRAELRTIRGHTDCIYAAVFSPDGRTLATSSYDKLIKLWDVATGKEFRTQQDHIDAVYALAFTPDGKRLVSAAADRTVKVWSVVSGERLYTMSEPLDGLNTLAVDPTGTRVAAGGLDKTIRIWQLGDKAGTLLTSLIAHEDAILKLAWSPDGKLLISSSADRTIKVFQAGDLTEIKTFDHQPDWVLSLDFAPDGKTFAAGRFNGSLEIYRTAGLEKTALAADTHR
jgi:mono/diheme cytochrome c family protein